MSKCCDLPSLKRLWSLISEFTGAFIHNRFSADCVTKTLI